MNNAAPDLLAETIPQFWQEFGFEPCSWKGFAGVRRRVTFRKGSILGEVARYFADDYIFWAPQTPGGERTILDSWRPADEVMSHRILLIGDSVAAKPLKKYFLFGFRGWVEVLPYRPGGPEAGQFRDLIFIVNKACEFTAKTKGGMPAANRD
jgi:hypothetical protein